MPILKFALILLFCLVVPLQRSVCQALPTEFKQTVGFIFGKVHIKDQNGTAHEIEAPLGTGFFVFWPDPRGGQDWGYFYFVTAKHVLKDTDQTFLKSIRVRLNLLSPEGVRNFDYVDIPVTDEKGNFSWYTDPEDVADEAVAFPIVPNQKRFAYKTIPNTMFASDQLLKDQHVSEGDSVFFVGLMAQFYGTKQNFPVVRKGSIALISDEPLPTPSGPQKGFICEVASWPGNSGSPVFLNLTGLRGGTLMTNGYWLLGIVVSYYNNTRTAETVETATVSLNDPANIGLAFVLPVSQINKVLTTPEVQRWRDIFTEQHNRESTSPKH